MHAHVLSRVLDSRLMKATWNGKVIAESNETREVGGYVYFPRSAVQMDLFSVSPKTGSDKECPHGVQFYDLAGSARAAWSYEAPKESMKQVDHWMGFWGDVNVSA